MIITPNAEKIILNETDFQQVTNIINGTALENMASSMTNEQVQAANEKAAEMIAEIREGASKLEDVLDTRSPAEVEAAMLKQAEDDAIAYAEGRDPAEIAAMCFHMFFPKFQQQVMFLSNKELRRLINAIVGKGHQSMPDTPVFKDKRAGEAYKMGLELLQAKFMMITKLEMDSIQKKVDDDEAAAKAVADSTVIETQYGAEASEGNSNE